MFKVLKGLLSETDKQGPRKQHALREIQLLIPGKICRNRIYGQVIFVEVQISYVLITVLIQGVEQKQLWYIISYSTNCETLVPGKKKKCDNKSVEILTTSFKKLS